MVSKSDNFSFYKILKKIIPMIFKACPLYSAFFFFIAMLQGISYVVNTIMTQKFFDSITNAAKGSSTNSIIIVTIGLGASLIINQILNGIYNFIPDDLSYRVNSYIGSKINEKAGRLDPIMFEDTSSLDHINKAHQGLMNSMFMFIILSSIVTFYIPYFLTMALYLYTLKPILAISLVIIFIPVAFTQFIRTKLFTNLSEEAAPIRREFEYYEKCIVDKEYYKETRFLGAYEYFKDLYISAIRLLNKKAWTSEKKSGLMELGMKVITLSGYIIVLYMLVQTLIKGELSVGAFSAVFASIGRIFSLMEQIICRHIGSISKNMGNIKHLVSFLELPEKEEKEFTVEATPGIKLQNICFKYPGKESQAVKNVSLMVHPGETIAVVGENGAGKSTLVKLMMGLYIPDSGKVFLGGADTSQAAKKVLYKRVSAVFQNFQRYKMSLGDNIAISDLNRNSIIKEELDSAAKKADLVMDEEKFKESYDTMLSREFDGIDLSGGQWQRIAIARGFYKSHDMIVLDEPTAAIDPIEETRIYNMFSEISKNKTAVLVTHRLGSAKIADRIVVMDSGTISEIGTHDELIDKNGKYAELYKAQSKWYVENT
ncbi:ABC transporter ATP-binding protein [Clostridium sp. 19966]|uniref:ABC transporter ATP-binding protein n=1 Tax=Clostridium sp. 19966 TaxID=2768166 RepID=UPI0028DF2D30|nr:ABC transporter ATP-binding protein [Clostridium sp. 19966]MDT8717344.1 ABC transporter ATP-binding protein [Clostridium sp. 19966]